jgi:hypothetical protein
VVMVVVRAGRRSQLRMQRNCLWPFPEYGVSETARPHTSGGCAPSNAPDNTTKTVKYAQRERERERERERVPMQEHYIERER